MTVTEATLYTLAFLGGMFLPALAGHIAGRWRR